MMAPTCASVHGWGLFHAPLSPAGWPGDWGSRSRGRPPLPSPGGGGRPRRMNRPGPNRFEDTAMVITDCKIAGLLTDDLLFNPRSGVPYPQERGRILGSHGSDPRSGGHFPGDPEAMREGGPTPSGRKA